MPAPWILAAGLVSPFVLILTAAPSFSPNESARATMRHNLGVHVLGSTTNTTGTIETVTSNFANKTLCGCSQLALVIAITKIVSFRRNPLYKFPGPFFAAISDVSSISFSKSLPVSPNYQDKTLKRETVGLRFLIMSISNILDWKCCRGFLCWVRC